MTFKQVAFIGAEHRAELELHACHTQERSFIGMHPRSLSAAGLVGIQMTGGS